MPSTLVFTNTSPALEHILLNSSKPIAIVDKQAVSSIPASTQLSSESTFEALARNPQDAKIATGNVLVENARLLAVDPPAGIPTSTLTPAVEVRARSLLGVTDGATVSAVVPSATEPVPSGFVLVGSTQVFGKLETQLFQRHDDKLGLQEIAIVQQKGPITIADFVPSMRGKGPDDIVLNSAEFVYNERDSPLRKAGTWLVADLALTGSLAAANNVLKNFFDQDKPVIHIEAFLTPAHDWAKPIDTNNLKLIASLPGTNFDVAELLTVTEIGLNVELRRGVPVPPNDIATVLTFGFYGKLNFKSPFGRPAQAVAFTLTEAKASMKLEISQLADAEHFFGLEGLKLSNTTFSTEFNVTQPVTSLAFNVAATITLNSVNLAVSGSYSKETWNIKAKLEHFDFNSIQQAYDEIFKAKLHTSYTQKISATDLVLDASPKGLVVTGKVNVQDHVATQAEIKLTQNGLTVKGSVDNVQLQDKIHLTKAELDVFIGKATDTTVVGVGTSFRFYVLGEISIASQVVKATLMLDYMNSKSVWTVYASLSGITIGDIAPALKGTFVDKGLLEAAVVASNQDGGVPNPGLIPPKYQIVKGFTIAASLTPIPELDLAMGNKTGTVSNGLTLQAVFTESDSIELRVLLAAPHFISLKGGAVTSGPVSLTITALPAPALVIAADIFVKVPGQQLKFTGGLVAKLTEASMFVELKDQYWNNPFGLGAKIALGPNLALSIGITYETATPTIGIAAGLRVGDVAGQGALSVSMDPSEELFMVEFDHLRLSDLVAFLALMTGEGIQVPENVLEFEKLEYYLSSGVTIGTKKYPAGASFEAAAQLFGKHASINVAVDKPTKQITAIGRLDAFEVGPLKVSGTTPGTPASFEVIIGATNQHIKIDGQADLMGSHVSLLTDATFLPSPNVILHAELHFVDHLKFDLDALAKGKLTSIKDLKSIAFDVHVLFEQDIIDYLIAQINTQFATAKHAVDDGIDKAKQTLDAAEKKFKDAVDAAQKKVNDARAAYEAKLYMAKRALAAEEQKASIRKTQLQDDLKRANEKLAAAIKAAQDALQSAINEQARRVTAAQTKIDEAKRDGDKRVDDALKNLNAAKADMQNRFGGAVQAVQSAQDKVNDVQNEVRASQRDVDSAQRDYDNASWWKKPAKLAILEERKAALKVKEAALAVAEGVLGAAKAVIQGPGYAATQAALSGYEGVLKAARTAADGALKAARAALEETKVAQQKLVDAASSGLDFAKNSSTEILNSRAAQVALDCLDSAEKGILQVLQTAVDAVGHGVEKAAFDSADAALAVARANTKDIEAAKGALDVAQHAGDTVLDAATWAAQHGGQLFQVKLLEAEAALGDIAGSSAKGLSVHLVGIFAGRNVDVRFDFTPNQGAELAKNMFKKLIADIKGHF